jgi:hypothetical protein
MIALKCPACGASGLEVEENNLTIISDNVVVYAATSDGIYKCKFCGTKSVLEPSKEYGVGGTRIVSASNGGVAIGGNSSGVIITGSIVRGTNIAGGDSVVITSRTRKQK